jgi:hypothetical protein
VLGDGVNVTVPVGALGVVAVSVTLAVHVVAEPVATEDGEQETAVVVGSSAANAGAATASSAITATNGPRKIIRRRFITGYSGIRS